MNTPPFALISSFLAFTKASSMEKAAHELKISQPALTSHLKQFESHFTQPVFSFSGRKKILTPFGLSLFNLFESKFKNLDSEITAICEEENKPQNVEIKIAGRSEIVNYLSDKIIFPGTLHFVSIFSEDSIVGLLDRKYDFAISYLLSEVGELHAKKIFSYTYSIAVPSGWKIKNNKLSKDLMEKLYELPFVSQRFPSENLDLISQKYSINLKPKFKIIISDWYKLVSLVEAGRGWTILPAYFAKNNKNIDLIDIPTSLIPEIQFYLLYRKETTTRFSFKDINYQIKKLFEIV